MSTSKIHVLPEAVASRIAAGEVLERPSSLIRELLDNALDAGAKKIRVRLELPKGDDASAWSVFRLTVEDDGSGMNPEDLGKAFLKHATSKIRDMEDVFTTETLGFRGEALAAIAAVSRVECRSSENAKGQGHRISFEGGRLKGKGPCPCPKGTLLTVGDLFFNAPARRKFLRTPRAERMDMRKEHLIRSLAHPGVHFILEERVGDEPWEVIQDLPPTKNLLDRVRTGFGDELARELRELPKWSPARGLHIHGLLSSHRHRGKTRAHQFFFHKGRPITNSTLVAALGHAYMNLMPSRTYPACFLFLTFPDPDVDVNVHPQKKDVRFRDPDVAYRLVHQAVKEALRGMLSTSIQTVRREGDRPNIFSAPQVPAAPVPWTFRPKERTEETPGHQMTLADHVAPSSPGTAKTVVDSFRILGQWKNLFIVFSERDELWIADQHALHERIHFDAFQKKMERSGPSQPLLTPLIVRPGSLAAGQLMTHEKDFKSLGLTLLPFGKDGVQVDELPHWLPAEQGERILREVLDRVVENPRAKISEIREHFLSTAACHASVRAGEPLGTGVMEGLIREYQKGGHADVCPHGRPFLFRLTEGALLKHFERPPCAGGLRTKGPK